MGELRQVVDLLTEIRDLLAAHTPPPATPPADGDTRTTVTGD